MGVQSQMRSVAMATYQGMPYIAAQMDSILAEIGPGDELVISDNGSTDGTLGYLQSIAQKDPRIRLLSLTSPKGVLPNFQNALQHCKGDIIFLCDQDDIWKPGKMNTIDRLFDSNPNLMAVQADADIIDSEGRRISDSFFSLRKCGPGLWKNFHKNTWQGCSMAFRRGLLEVALPFPRKIPMHDVWIGMLAEMAGDVLFLRETLTSYRRHSDNQSLAKPAGVRQVVLWRLRLLGAIFLRLPVAGRIRKRKRAK
jgi:glycosyltransferase involved in cell wall biosynthesis